MLPKKPHLQIVTCGSPVTIYSSTSLVCLPACPPRWVLIIWTQAQLFLVKLFKLNTIQDPAITFQSPWGKHSWNSAGRKYRHLSLFICSCNSSTWLTTAISAICVIKAIWEGSLDSRIWDGRTIGIGPVPECRRRECHREQSGTVKRIRQCKCTLCSAGVRRMGGEMARFEMSSTNNCERLTHCCGPSLGLPGEPSH